MEKNMVLELIDVFKDPYNGITNYLDAAKYVIQNCSDNGMNFHVEDALKTQRKQQNWKLSEKNIISKALHTYQQRYAQSDKAQVDADIKSMGITMSLGQIVYHGGVLAVDQTQNSVTLSAPLSTTFNPTVARNEALYKGKAYLSNALHINVIKLQNTNLRAFPFKSKSRMGHEAEVLFEAGIKLKKTNDNLINPCYLVCYYGEKAKECKKNVEAHIIEWEMV